MKVLIYFQDADTIKTSGIGRAMQHQMKALTLVGVPFTIKKTDDFTLAHINTIWAKSHRLLRRCKRKGIPVIVHGHSTYEDFRRSFACWRLIEPIFDRQIRYMYSRADLIITPTPYSKKLIESYGFNVPVVSISNGIDVARYAPNPHAVEAFRAKFGVKEGEKFVMGVGFPFERKGLQDFFEVARKFPDVKFFWFGHLARIAMSSKMKRAIRHKPANAIMAGYCSGDLILGAYQSALCLFFPSYEETEGIVTLEALASKTPLVVRDIGVYEGWLHDGVDCHMGHSNEEFAAAIERLLKQGEDPKILEAGYAVAEERTLDKVGLKLKEAYEELEKRKGLTR
jgi:1,2-diacylglycerol-3-alpha-glucose alpha-1,2-glucosyltransferase